MDTLLSYQCFAPHLKVLRSCGYYQMDSKSPAMQKFLHSIYVRFVFGLLSLYILQECMKIYEVRDNAVQVMDTIFVCLSYSNTLIKKYVLKARAPLVEELLAITRGPLFNQGLPSHNELLRITCRHALRFLRFYQCLGVSTVIAWTIYPIVLHVRGIHQPFTIWLPFDETVDPQFYIAITYFWLQVTWVAIGTSTSDSFITFLFVQSKTQIAILRLDLEALVEKSKEIAAEKDIELTTALTLRLKAIMTHYAEIDNFNVKLQECFGTVIFIQFLLSGWILCATIYRMASLSSFIDFMSTGMYLMCMLWENFLFCYYGNDLNNESTALLDSTYRMDWVQLSVPQRRSLIIFMERLKRPMLLVGGGIIPLTNATFITIMKSAYSFYAFMNNSTTK